MITMASVVTVARRLTEVGVDDGVFVGGSVVGLYLTDSLAPLARHTDDVDVVVPVANRVSYNQLEARMRQAGHEQVLEGPTCRWMVAGVPVDIMPTDATILGFGNRWYPALIRSPMDIETEQGELVRVASTPYFVATKIEAFLGRGNDDYLGSRDIEDIVVIIDGRKELYDDLLAADPEVRSYLVDKISKLTNSRDFIDALPGHMLPDEASQARIDVVLARMRRIGTIR